MRKTYDKEMEKVLVNLGGSYNLRSLKKPPRGEVMTNEE